MHVIAPEEKEKKGEGKELDRSRAEAARAQLGYSPL
jgi:hypothetical protein